MPKKQSPNDDQPKPGQKWIRSRHVKLLLNIGETSLKLIRKHKLVDHYQPIPRGNYLYDREQMEEWVRSKKR